MVFPPWSRSPRPDPIRIAAGTRPAGVTRVTGPGGYARSEEGARGAPDTRASTREASGAPRRWPGRALRRADRVRERAEPGDLDRDPVARLEEDRRLAK